MSSTFNICNFNIWRGRLEKKPTIWNSQGSFESEHNIGSASNPNCAIKSQPNFPRHFTIPTVPPVAYPIMGGFDSQDWQPYYAAHLLLILRRRGAVAMVTERETFNFLSSIIIIYGAICCGKWIQPHLHDW